MRRVLLGLTCSFAFTAVLAADPLGIYIGAGAGQARVKADDGPNGALNFNQTDTGWDAFVGLRPLPIIGAELQYIDFGNPTTQNGIYKVSSLARAPAAFVIASAPLPFVDLCAKAGVGRVHTTITEDTSLPIFCAVGYPDCAHGRSDATDTRFGWGLGVQFKLASFGIRGEYVRFSAPNGDPNLLSVALLYRF